MEPPGAGPERGWGLLPGAAAGNSSSPGAHSAPALGLTQHQPWGSLSSSLGAHSAPALGLTQHRPWGSLSHSFPDRNGNSSPALRWTLNREICIETCWLTINWKRFLYWSRPTGNSDLAKPKSAAVKLTPEVTAPVMRPELILCHPTVILSILPCSLSCMILFKTPQTRDFY